MSLVCGNIGSNSFDEIVFKKLEEYTIGSDKVEWVYHKDFVVAENEEIVRICNNYRVIWLKEAPDYMFLLPKR